MDYNYIYKEGLFKGKIILVTGATSGIGYETSRALSKLGAKLIIIGRSISKLKSLKNLLEDTSKVITYEVDLSKPKSCKKLIESLPEDCLPLDGLFHSAGDILLKPISLSNEEDFDKLARVSLNSTLDIARLVSKKKYFADKSSIILMSSISSLLGTTGIGYYSAIKSSINSICRSMAIEFSSREIRVNTILAGAIETSMHKKIESKLSLEYINKYRNKHLLGFGKPNDIANMVCFLLSPASKWITGSSITVDGGYSSFK